MSGIDSSDPASAATDSAPLLNFSVHSLPAPEAGAAARRTARGRLVMALVLAICAAPVIAAYVAYFGLRPQGRSNYAELIEPTRPLPANLPLTDLARSPVAAASLRGQWLIVVVAGGACDVVCERQLLLQRQLHESLGRERDRVDKLWLIDDDALPAERTLRAIKAFGFGSQLPFTPITVLRSPPAALATWLQPAPQRSLQDHLYVVDPRGEWMMRAPVDADPRRLKADLEKLLRASAGWDRPGR